jgi:cyanophycin synthetase
MRITETHLLRGPNLWADTPCLLAIIESGAADAATPGFVARLLAALPGIAPEAAARLSDSGCVAEAVEPVVMELQRLAAAPGGFSCTVTPSDNESNYRAVCGYTIEQLATEALAQALELIAALARSDAFPVDETVERLSAIATRYAIGTSTGAVLAAAHRRGIPSLRLTEEANLFQLGWGSRQKRLQATITGATNSIAVGIAGDKQLTKALLEQAGVPTPAGATACTVEEAQRIARRLGALVTIKPLDGNQGKGVTTMCGTPEEVARAYEHARSYGRQVIVEEYLPGRDYRVLVTGSKVAAASWRRPPCVTGDGRSSVRELVEVENRNPARGAGHTNILTRIPIDELAEQTLARQGYGLDSVPPAGTQVDLRGNANLSTGGTAEDVTDLLPESTRELCVRAARTIGLDVAGIDIVCEDIALPLRGQQGGIIEINAAPGIRMHQYPSRGQARDAGAAIIDTLFGQDDGHIPVVAVAGTSGKTTTSLMIAHVACSAGVRTGAATSSGVFIDGEPTLSGNCSGYRSARSVLASPEVDIAVLETAREGILEHGLAFDRCHVAIVLNVSADRPGGDGANSLDEHARADAVLARHARSAVVLNAEDAHCVAMARALEQEVEVLYFSLDADNPVLLRHLERGGRAAYLQDNALVMVNGLRHTALLDVRDMPASLDGRARDNIANALAACCALASSGFGDDEITDGLRSFVSDRRQSPRSHRIGIDSFS